MATIVEPSPSTLARTLVSNRSRAVAAHGLLDDDADPRARRTARPTRSGGCRSRRSAHALVDDRGLDDVGRDLDARDEVAALDDLAVEDREHLERIEPVQPLELGDPDVDDARRRGDEVDPALVRAADVEARAGHGPREADRGVVLVELAGLGDEDGDRRTRLRGRERQAGRRR